MTSIRLRAGAALAAVALATGACGGDEPTVTPTTTATTEAPTVAPSPTGPVTFTEGEATVETTGDRTESFTAAVDDESVFDPEENGYDLLFVDDDRNALRVGLDWETGSDDSPFIAVGLPGTSLFDEHYFADQFSSQCDVEVTSATPFAIEGSFSCEDLERGDGEQTIDVTGTFSATA